MVQEDSVVTAPNPTEEATSVAVEASPAEPAAAAEPIAEAQAATPAEPEPEVASTPAVASVPEPASGPEPEPMPVAAGEAEPAPEATKEASPAVPAEHATEHPLDAVAAELRELMAAGMAVEGTVFGWNKGGFHVALKGLPAFCPSSQIELGKSDTDPATFVDKTFHFRILREEKEGKRFVVSRAAALVAERDSARNALRARLQPGAVLEGTVKTLTAFGAFVDLGGIEGLVHVSEISRKRIEKPEEALSVGQPVTVKVLKLEQSGKRVSLSIKELEPDPWATVASELTVGGPFTGTIVRKSPFGLFVEVAPGLEGLLHQSMLPPGGKLEDPAYAPGQTVTGFVREIEKSRHRLSLSLREVATTDPWKNVGERYPEGHTLEGTVEKTTPIGSFIELEPGLVGLMPQSEMRLPKGNDPRRVFAPGKKVMVTVTHVDPKRKRISLAPEGAKVEGSRADYQAYVKKVDSEGGFSALAAALSKVRGQ